MSNPPSYLGRAGRNIDSHISTPGTVFPVVVGKPDVDHIGKALHSVTYLQLCKSTQLQQLKLGWLIFMLCGYSFLCWSVSYTHTHTHIHTYRYTQTCTHAHTCTYTFTHSYICPCTAFIMHLQYCKTWAMGLCRTISTMTYYAKTTQYESNIATTQIPYFCSSYDLIASS